jgi:hypothetical protein
VRSTVERAETTVRDSISDGPVGTAREVVDLPVAIVDDAAKRLRETDDVVNGAVTTPPDLGGTLDRLRQATPIDSITPALRDGLGGFAPESASIAPPAAGDRTSADGPAAVAITPASGGTDPTPRASPRGERTAGPSHPAADAAVTPQMAAGRGASPGFDPAIALVAGNVEGIGALSADGITAGQGTGTAAAAIAADLGLGGISHVPSTLPRAGGDGGGAGQTSPFPSPENPLKLSGAGSAPLLWAGLLAIAAMLAAVCPPRMRWASRFRVSRSCSRHVLPIPAPG